MKLEDVPTAYLQQLLREHGLPHVEEGEEEPGPLTREEMIDLLRDELPRIEDPTYQYYHGYQARQTESERQEVIVPRLPRRRCMDNTIEDLRAAAIAFGAHQSNLKTKTDCCEAIEILEDSDPMVRWEGADEEERPRRRRRRRQLSGQDGGWDEIFRQRGMRGYRSDSEEEDVPFAPLSRLPWKTCMDNDKEDIEARAETLGIPLKHPNGKKKTKKELCAEIDFFEGGEEAVIPVIPQARRDCMTMLKAEIEREAAALGIPLKHPNGKAKTKKDLCGDIDRALAGGAVAMPRARTPSRTRTRSIPRARTPPPPQPKKNCMTMLKAEIEREAAALGIPLKHPNGKAKTKKDLCGDLERAARSRPGSRVPSVARARSVSPIPSSARARTPPIQPRKNCMTMLKAEIEREAAALGIPLKHPNGKAKTKKDLCDDIDRALAGGAVARSRPVSPIRARVPSVLRARTPSGPRTRAVFKKAKCMDNLKADIEAVARDYGIPLKHPNGKAKTKKDLCDDIERVIQGEQSESRAERAMAAGSPSVSRRPVSPVAVRSSTPGAGRGAAGLVVPDYVVRALLGQNEDMLAFDLLKRVSRDDLVQYARTFKIDTTNMTKPTILLKIMENAAQEAHSGALSVRGRQPSEPSRRDISIQASLLSEDIAEDVVSEVSRILGVDIDLEEVISDIQGIIHARIRSGQSTNASSVASELASSLSRSRTSRSSSRSSPRMITRTRSRSSSRSSPRMITRTRSRPSSRSLSRSIESSSASDLVKRESLASVSIAVSIDPSVAEDIESRLRVSQAEAEVVVDNIASQLPSVDIDVVESIAADESIKEAIKGSVDVAESRGQISRGEARAIIAPISRLEEEEAISVSRPPVSRSVRQELERPIREIPRARVAHIENLLREIQRPEEVIGNIALIQRRVFTCLGLIN